MPDVPDEVELAARLVQIDTSGRAEDDVFDVLAPLLEAAGFEVARPEWRPRRGSLLATWAGGGQLVLSGHADTVPFSSERWQVDPLGGQIIDGRLFGRGSSDMKSGLAAMTCAALDAARNGARGFTVALTSAEETGCLGARSLAETASLPDKPILVVGESTGNEVRLGHKGATWLRAAAHGRSAHGSRPDLGVNAISKLAQVIVDLEDIDPGTRHERLGRRTVNVGTVLGGQQANLVPDHAEMTVDVRSVPGAGAGPVRSLIESTLGVGTTELVLDLPPVWTDENSGLTRAFIDAVASVTGTSPAPTGVSYFTDAAVFGNARGASTFIVGPGDLDQPHTTDESCCVDAIRQAREIYLAVLGWWSSDRLTAG